MGFMAGFGDAFSRSFEQGMDRNAKRRDDLFKITYDNFLQNREETKKLKAEDSAAARKAEALIEQSGVDPRAYPFVYKQVRAGVDESTLVNDLRTGRFEFDEAEKESVKTDGADEGAPHEEADPMAAQMDESGMAPQEAAAPAEAPAAPKVGGLAEGLGSFLNMGGRRERQGRRALEDVAGAVGMTPEEVAAAGEYTPEEIDTSGIRFTPPNAQGDFVTLGEAIFKRDQAKESGNVEQYKHFDDMVKSHDLANQMEEQAKTGGAMWLVRDKEGNVKHVMGQQTENGILDPMSPEGEVLEPIRQVSEEELKLYSDLAVDSKPITEYKKKQADLAGLYTLGDELSQMADLSPEALTTVGGVSTGLAAITREADALVNMVGDMGASPAQMKELADYENKITEALLSPGMKNAAEVRTLMEAKLKLASYRFSASEGEDGRSRSNLDIQRFDEILRASRDPEVFKQSLASYLADIESQVDTEGRALNQYNPIINTLEGTYGYSPVGAIVPTFSEFFEGTSDSPSYENVKKFHEKNNVLNQTPAPTPTGETPAVVAPEQTAPVATPNARHIEALKANPALAAEFDKKFGAGASQQILQGQ